MKKGLIVFARKPVPGKVKTRLARDLGAHAAAELYAAMLEDVLRATTGQKSFRTMVFWATDDGSIPDLSAQSVESFVQSGADLGERMKNAFIRAFDSGVEACCIIGSDAPDLPVEYIHQAFSVLEQDRADVVFGPAEDGGYYLLGVKQLWPRLFEDIAWSSPQVLEVSCERATELNLRTTLLPGWYDIDTIDDLRRLTESTAGAHRTRETLRSIVSTVTKEACA